VTFFCFVLCLIICFFLPSTQTEYLVHFLKQKKHEAVQRHQQGQQAQQAVAAAQQQQQQQQQRPNPGNLTPEQRAQYERQKQLQLRQKQQQQQQQVRAAAAARQQQPQQKQPVQVTGAPTMDSLMQDIHKKREQITQSASSSLQKATGAAAATSATATSKTTIAAASTSTVAPKTTTGKPSGKGRAGSAASSDKDSTTSKGGKKAPRRKSGSGSTGASGGGGGSTASSRKTSTSSSAKDNAASSAAASAPASAVAAVTANLPKVSRQSSVTAVKEEPPPKEYQELMSMIENSIEYDWPSVLDLCGSKQDFDLSEEERKLLYDATTPMPSLPTKTVKKDEEEKQVQKDGDSSTRHGWGRTNILSDRSAWSRVRLKEQKMLEAEASRAAPTVGDGILTLPSPTTPKEKDNTGDSPSKGGASTTTTQSTEEESTKAELPDLVTWTNEETAEQDKTLALLSEGTQLYLKGVLEKAIQCARQRQNLDGIRLWHQQYASLPQAVNSKTKGSTLTAGKADPANKPHLSLRLGCDVSRQIAQSQGNAAMTCKRMEEALERQPDVSSTERVIDDDTLREATSMGDLSLKPLLKAGVARADLQAKRSYEIYGGKFAKDPPFGRVPKRGKLEVADFLMGSRIMPGNGQFHTASNASGFLSF
jgi:hypothetical protein